MQKSAILRLLPLVFGACAHPENVVPIEPSRTADAPQHRAVAASTEPAAGTSAANAKSAEPPKASSVDEALPGKSPARSLSELISSLSEKDRYYFSHNYVSNETSQLQVAPLLMQQNPHGGAYIGVGPEQNFSYIALTRPEIAFVVDIRRRNMLLHLLYKAIFQEARSRSHFLTLLVGRPYDAASDPGAAASIADVIAHAEAKKPDRELWRDVQTGLVERIASGYKVELSASDRVALRESHQAFFEDQLDIQFELHMKTRPRYPKLRDQLAMKAPDGRELGFMASEQAFRFVQRMQAEHRIVPVVGDFAGNKTLPGIAAYLREQSVTLSVFYVSNVEEFLFEDKVWPSWVKNVEALPTDEKSLFVRAWMNHHPRHPRQLPGERTTTVIQRVVDFRALERDGSGFKGYRALAFDDSNVTVSR